MPLQIVPLLTATVGFATTVTVKKLGLPTHPTDDVPTTEYVEVTLGVTTILDVDAPVDQAYELAVPKPAVK